MSRYLLPGFFPGAAAFAADGTPLDPVTALLERAASVVGVQVYDGAVVDEDGVEPADLAYPYVVVYAGLGALSRTTLARTSDRLALRPQLTHVGTSPEQVRWAQSRTRGVLVDVVLAVAGRRQWPLTLTDSQPVRRDSDVRPPVFFAPDVYSLDSVHSAGT